MPKWIRDFLILPVMVGLIIASISFILPQLFAKSTELSYEIEEPTSVLDEPGLGVLTIQIDGEDVSRLYTSRVRLVNSGDNPIKDLAVRFVFSNVNGEFSILNVSHQTQPRYEFGSIKELDSPPNARRYEYELLNVRDEDLITFVTTDSANIGVYAKAENLSVNRVEPPTKLPDWIEVGIMALAAVGAVLISNLLERADWLERALVEIGRKIDRT